MSDVNPHIKDKADRTEAGDDTAVGKEAVLLLLPSCKWLQRKDSVVLVWILRSQVQRPNAVQRLRCSEKGLNGWQKNQ